jgi:hypothetical protein
MFKPTNELAQELIAADQLRLERYLELIHLDPAPLAAIYVRAIALRYALRRLRRGFGRGSFKDRDYSSLIKKISSRPRSSAAAKANLH